MIGPGPTPGHYQMPRGFLQEILPEHCFKATPDPEFLSNLYSFDISFCLRRNDASTYPARSSDIAEFFKETFEVINSTRRIPELLIWMKSQVCPTVIVLSIFNDFHCSYQRENLFTYHRQSIELWLYEELFAKLSNQSSFEVFQHLLASITLVDFPQFRDIHHLIPLVLDTRSNYWTDFHGYERNNGTGIEITKNSEKWEIYVEYRKIVSQFLIDQARSEIPRDPRFSSINFIHWSRGGQKPYVSLAKHLLIFLSECHW